MRAFLYILSLGLLAFAPVKRLDVARLEPVEAVAVYRKGDWVFLQTDTGDMGKGTDAVQALEAMKRNTASVIYLDTAQILLVGEDTEQYVQQLRQYLHGSVLVGEYRGDDVKEAAEYEKIHGTLTKLRRWKTNDGNQRYFKKR